MLRVVDGGRDADAAGRISVGEEVRQVRNRRKHHAGEVPISGASVIIGEPGGRRFVPTRRSRYLSVIEAQNHRRGVFARACLRWAEAEERLGRAKTTITNNGAG